MDILKDNDRRYKVFIKIAIIIGIYLGMKFLLPLVWPFVIAFFVVAFLYPYIKKIARKTHISIGLLTGGMLLLIVLPVSGILLFLLNQCLSSIGNMLGKMGSIQETIAEQIGICCSILEKNIGIQADEIEYFLQNKIFMCINSLQDKGIPVVMGKSVSYMLCMTSALAGILITGIAIVLLMKDYGELWTCLRKSPYIMKIYEIIWKIVHLLFIFLRAQLLIMFVIAVISGIGFYILGVKHYIILALITSFLDMLPFIGTGIMILPFALWNLLQGKLLQTLGFVLLYGICAFARELLEPKLIGEKVGIYPIGILFSIYVGVKLFGFSGILLGPVSMLLIMEVFQIDLYKK